MTSIVEFLTARLNEAEAVAVAASTATDDEAWQVNGGGYGVYAGFPNASVAVDGFGHMNDDVARHIARHDPTHVLADIAAKRRILDEHWPEQVASLDKETRGQAFTVCACCRRGERQIVYPCPTVKNLAALADRHPEYNESWRPT